MTIVTVLAGACDNDTVCLTPNLIVLRATMFRRNESLQIFKGWIHSAFPTGYEHETSPVIDGAIRNAGCGF